MADDPWCVCARECVSAGSVGGSERLCCGDRCTQMHLCPGRSLMSDGLALCVYVCVYAGAASLGALAGNYVSGNKHT